MLEWGGPFVGAFLKSVPAQKLFCGGFARLSEFSRSRELGNQKFHFSRFRFLGQAESSLWTLLTGRVKMSAVASGPSEPRRPARYYSVKRKRKAGQKSFQNIDQSLPKPLQGCRDGEKEALFRVRRVSVVCP